MSDWIKIMLEEIDRKEAETKAEREEAQKRRQEKSARKSGSRDSQDPAPRSRGRGTA